MNSNEGNHVSNGRATSFVLNRINLFLAAVKDLFKDLGGDPAKLPPPSSPLWGERVRAVVRFMIYGPEEHSRVVCVHRWKSIGVLLEEHGFEINPTVRHLLTSDNFPLPSAVEADARVEQVIKVDLLPPPEQEVPYIENLARVAEKKCQTLDWQQVLELAGQHRDLQIYRLVALKTTITINGQKYVLFTYENQERLNVNLALCSGNLPGRLRIPVIKEDAN